MGMGRQEATFTMAGEKRRFSNEEKDPLTWKELNSEPYEARSMVLRSDLNRMVDYLSPCSFRCQEPVTEVHGRTFGVWTLLTCTLCFLCAFKLDNRPLYLATLLSFIYAFGHFLTEYLLYQTMAMANLTKVGIFAGASIIWMLLQWNTQQKNDIKRS